MPAQILRSFSYYDKQFIEDALAALEGALISESTIVQTQESEKSLTGDGQAGISGIARADLKRTTGSSAKTEVTKQAVMTDASKFQRLYTLLDDEVDSGFQYYDNINSDMWSNFEKGDILELELSLSPSHLCIMTSAMRDLMGIAKVIGNRTGKSIFDSISKEQLSSLEMLMSLEELESQKNVPVKMNPREHEAPTFVAYLNPEYLRVPRGHISGEYTVFGKIQRKLKEDETLDLFNPLAAIETIQKISGKLAGIEKGKLPPEVTDKIKAPAAIILPMAIYR
jgi:hypothetical protein